MQNLTRFVVIVMLGLSGGHWCSSMGQSLFSATQQSTTAKKTAGATVSGRVTLQGKGRGGIVVGVRIRDLMQQSAQGWKGTTDADGYYVITDIPAGNYQVVPLAPGYVVPDYTSMSGLGKALLLNEGERVDGVDFSIIRGAVITGRVAYSDGRPVVEESVYLIPADQPDQGRRFVGSSIQTDDRGIYRMFGLRGGRYKVCIGISDEATVPTRSRPAFQRMFHPGVTEFTEAKVIEITEGSEAANVDITVGQMMKAFVATGVVIDSETKQPLPNLRIALQKVVEGSYAPFMGSSSISDAQGEFRLENVTPGKYSVFVLGQLEGDSFLEPVRIEIVDQDVSGITLQPNKGAVISGVVALESSQDKRLLEQLLKHKLAVFVRAGDQPDMTFGGSRTALLDPNGGFRLGGLRPGTAMFGLNSNDRSQSGFAILRIERDGVVQPRSGMEIKSKEQVTGVRIVVIYGSGTIRGTVKWDGGLPPASSRLMVRLTKAGDKSYAIRPEELDARGRFVFSGVPAGDYEVVLGSYVRVGNAPLSVKQAVTVTDGATAEVELNVETNSKNPPTP